MDDVDQAGLRTGSLLLTGVGGEIKVFRFIQLPLASVIEPILKHCGLWQS